VDGLDMPAGWALAPLSALVLPVRNSDPSRYFRDYFTYFDIGSIDCDTKTIQNPKRVHAQEAPSRARRVVRAGDVLFSTVRPYLRAIAQVHDLADGVASTGFCVLRPATGVSSRFLYYVVQSDDFIKGLLPLQRGVSYPAVSDSDIKKQMIRVPPSAEQVRIANKLDGLLDKLNRGVEETRLALHKSEKLRHHLIDQAFTGVLTHAWRSINGIEATASARRSALPASWRGSVLGEFIISASYGTSVKTEDDGEGMPILRIPNVVRGKIDLSDLKFATKPIPVKDNDYLRPGDLLVVRTNGSVNLVGRAALVDKTLPQSFYFASYLVRIRVDQGFVLPGWVERYFASSRGRNWFEERAASTSGQHNINLSMLREMPIPVPPLKEQEEALRILDGQTASLVAEEISMREVIAESHLQRSQLLTSAIAGALTRRQASDEAVEDLLERAQREQADALQKRSARSDIEAPQAEEILNDRISKILEQQHGWTEAQAVFERWCAGAPKTTTAVEGFYAELRGLVSNGIVEVSSLRGPGGLKLGDQIRLGTGDR
jgi:type I restriction enzyme, S subunit